MIETTLYGERQKFSFRSGRCLDVGAITIISRPWKTGGPSRRKSEMNKYGAQAMQMWQQLAPSALAALEDPNRHFSTLGEEAAGQVVDLTIELQGPDVPGETYFDKISRIETAKLRAEEIVREELLIPPAEIREPAEDESENLGLDPSPETMTAVWEVLHGLSYGPAEKAATPLT